MVSIRLLSALCVALILAACAPEGASAQTANPESGWGEELDGMGQALVSLFNREAARTEGRLRVSFRPARTGSQGVDIYCEALSHGLRNALAERVQAWRDRLNSLATFDVAVADERAVAPPDVTISWSWDGAGSVRVEAHVLLAGMRSARVPAVTLDAAGLSGPERACLFSFLPGAVWVEAREAGELFEEPTFRPDAWVADYEAGARLRVLGRLEAADGSGGVWWVVARRDPETGDRRNLFATGLVGIRRPAVGSVLRDCAQCPEMVVVPAGNFTMGSPRSEEGRNDNEGPVHHVTIPARFAVGVYEVMRGEFGRFVSSTGRSMGNGCITFEDGEWKGRSGRSWRSPGFWQTDWHPVVCVSWSDAQAYVDWLSLKTGKAYRLLSESEWEYVARAGTTIRYHWDDAIGRNLANCGDCGSRWDFKGTSPVGVFGANAFGLYDVHGNVGEWVEDCYNDSYAGAPRDGSAWKGGNCDKHVVRGGVWLNSPRHLRVAFHSGFVPGNRGGFHVGFRVARTFTP